MLTDVIWPLCHCEKETSRWGLPSGRCKRLKASISRTRVLVQCENRQSESTTQEPLADVLRISNGRNNSSLMKAVRKMWSSLTWVECIQSLFSKILKQKPDCAINTSTQFIASFLLWSSLISPCKIGLFLSEAQLWKVRPTSYQTSTGNVADMNIPVIVNKYFYLLIPLVFILQAFFYGSSHCIFFFLLVGL